MISQQKKEEIATIMLQGLKDVGSPWATHPGTQSRVANALMEHPDGSVSFKERTDGFSVGDEFMIAVIGMYDK